MTNKPLFVIDLDRTLVDTDKIVEALASSLTQQGYDGKALVGKIEKARLSENNINIKKAIESLGGKAWENLKKYFLEEGKRDEFVFADTRPFLRSLSSAGLPYIILTFGISKEWQDLKLTSAGLDGIPAIVSASREKSKIINNWRDSSGVYTPPGFAGLSGDGIVLVDDRPNAFLHISANDSIGYLLDRSGELEPGFKLPVNVRIINSLSEIEI